METQSIPDNTKVKFDLRDYSEKYFCEELDITKEQLQSIKHITGKVICLKTFSELGDKDFEYYCVKMDNGVGLEGVSGYHLYIV